MVRMAHPGMLIAVLLALNFSAVHAAEQRASLEIGIAPYLPIKVLVKNYAPLRDYLQARLHMPVTLVSAANYKTFYIGIQNHNYPVIITTANSAYLAWSESSYIPLLQPRIPTRPVLVIDKNRQLADLNDLRGKTVATTDRLGIVAMQGVEMLHHSGLNAGTDFTMQYMQNQSAAANLVLSREATAAIVSDRSLLQMHSSISSRIKIVRTWDEGAAPGVIYMGSPKLPRAEIDQIKNAIQEFAQNSAVGILLMKKMGYGGLTEINEENLKLLAPYGKLLRQELSR
jgi:phosphonate transport system substrate-binding protein